MSNRVIRTTNGDSNFQKEEQSECFSMRAMFKKTIIFGVCFDQQGYWKTQHSQTQLHQEESLFFVKRDADGTLGVV